MMRANRRRTSGAAALEFAIITPVLLALVIGLIEWGRYFVLREAIVHATREGARAGTLLDGTQADACAAVTTFLSSAGITASCGSGVSVNTAYSVDSDDGPIDAVRVDVDIDIEPLSGLSLGIPDDIQAVAIMPR